MLIGLIACGAVEVPPAFEVPDGPWYGVIDGRLSAPSGEGPVWVTLDGQEIAGDDGDSLNFQVDTRDWDDGAHLLRGSAGPSGVETWVEVEFHQAAGDRSPPRVRFLAPQEGDRFDSSDPYIILDVGDDVGVRRVQLLDEDMWLADVPVEGPWEFRWVEPPPGRHRLVAAVLDVAGKTTSAEVRVEVGEVAP